MGTARLRLLLDTNVLVDEHIPTRPHAEATRALLTLAVTQGHRLLYSARVLPDVYFQICQYYKRQVLAERGEVSETDALAIQDITSTPAAGSARSTPRPSR
jgi:predicted nucleic acid-binding protein